MTIAYWSCTGHITERQIDFKGQAHHNLINVNQDKMIADESGNIVDYDQRPVELMETLIKLFTREKDWILEVASGTGSAMIASLRSGRNCLGT
ncbi:uncharacterized protein LOC144350913 [Saccoglossus kowalevskii]